MMLNKKVNRNFDKNNKEKISKSNLDKGLSDLDYNSSDNSEKEIIIPKKKKRKIRK